MVNGVKLHYVVSGEGEPVCASTWLAGELVRVAARDSRVRPRWSARVCDRPPRVKLRVRKTGLE